MVYLLGLGLKQTQKDSLHDQVMGNEGMQGTVGKLLKMVRMGSCREAVSYSLRLSCVGQPCQISGSTGSNSV
jgi:hypothetical protein